MLEIAFFQILCASGNTRKDAATAASVLCLDLQDLLLLGHEKPLDFTTLSILNAYYKKLNFSVICYFLHITG